MAIVTQNGTVCGMGIQVKLQCPHNFNTLSALRIIGYSVKDSLAASSSV